MEQIFYEMISKAAEGPLVGDLLKFAGAYWIISSRLTAPIRKLITALTENQDRHAQDIVLLKQDTTYIRGDVKETRKEVEKTNTRIDKLLGRYSAP